MLYRVTRNVVANGCLPFEKASSPYILIASRSSPVFLVSVLVSHVPKEIPTHKVIVQIRLLVVLPISDELIREGIDQQSSDWYAPFGSPRSHHPTQGHQVFVA